MLKGIDIFKTLRRSARGSCHPRIADPRRDWSIIVALFALALAGAAVLATYLYLSVLDSEREVANNFSSASISESGERRLDDLTAARAALDLEHAELLAKPLSLPDPSKAK